MEAAPVLLIKPLEVQAVLEAAAMVHTLMNSLLLNMEQTMPVAEVEPVLKVEEMAVMEL